MKRYFALLGCIVLLLVYSVLSLSADPTVIIVEHADLYETNALTDSPTLMGLLNAVADRMTLTYGDTVRHLSLAAVPPALSTLLNAVADRIRLTYGDRVRHLPLTVVPPALQTELNAIADRFVLQYPDDNRRFTLNYPLAIIGDSTPPNIITTPQANFTGSTARITWTTNEFTTYVLQYGVSSGSYPNQVSSSLFNRQHTAVIPGLTGDLYYYRIVSTDLSGNTSTSQEYVLEAEQNIFLPVILRP
ncbi:MAG: fibronectin type III domain-containing protein [Anaerolineae bacterium]|nr:fibronectin type III domain-containing protein [Anaerolineae bacterium]